MTERAARRRVRDADEYGLSRQAIRDIADSIVQAGGMSSRDLFREIDAAARREGRAKK